MLSGDTNRISEEQRGYAGHLAGGMKISVAVLLTTFVVYMLEALPPHIPLSDLPKYWGLSAKEFLHQAQVKPGWGWTEHVGAGDYLNIIGVAILSGLAAVCYIRVIPVFLRKRDFIYTTIAVAEVLLIALAASGILHVGGH